MPNQTAPEVLPKSTHHINEICHPFSPGTIPLFRLFCLCRLRLCVVSFPETGNTTPLRVSQRMAEMQTLLSITTCLPPVQKKGAKNEVQTDEGRDIVLGPGLR